MSKIRKTHVKSAMLICVIVCILFSFIKPALAGELGHYMPGVATIRDFVVPNEPSFYYMQYNIYYSADKYKDRDGDTADELSLGPVTVDVDSDLDVIAIVPMFMWVSPWEVLGAKYAAWVNIPVQNTSVQASLSAQTRFGADIDEDQWGLGDINIRPIWLGWNSKHFATSLGYDIYAPTGKYDDEDVDNTGLGFWTHGFQAAITWFPWEHQGTAVAVVGTYEMHGEKDGVDITPGDRFTLEYGVSQYVPVNKAQTLLAELGITGYGQWQVDEDSGSDVVDALNTKDEIYGIGGQIGLTYVPWNAALVIRYLSEYDAEARFEGELFTICLAKGF